MANNLTTLQEIIKDMNTLWISNPCQDGGTNGFYFGWPQEVDDIHNKSLPLMIVNPPSQNMSARFFEQEYGVVTNKYTLQIYQYLPSENDLQPSENMALLWDNIEDCFYKWLQNLLNNFGPNKIIMGDGDINIIRNKEASNDRLYMSQFEFNLKTYRECLTLQ